MFYRAAQRRERRREANSIAAFAIAYGGCKTTEGYRAMEKTIASLRE